MNLFFINSIKPLFSSEKELIYSIKNILGFYPGNIFLYRLAFRHKSVAQKISNGVKHSNERLEYLGDAVLGSVVADFLFKKFPYNDEGFLTGMRSKIVSRSTLNKLSFKLGIHKLIQSNGESKNLAKSMKGDAFEALIGAIYLDKGYNFTKKVIINRIIKIHFDIEELVKLDVNAKSSLIEWVQKEKQSIEFNVINEIGEGYRKLYVVEIVINKKPISKAQDFSIKGAERLASEKALAIILPDEK
ncbi:MAG: ribonuclease III [Bacteroidales bacterium]|nr:ribonuclease III [Bacteroidales bacterium]